MFGSNKFFGKNIKLFNITDSVSVSFNPSIKTTIKTCNASIHLGTDSSTSLAFNSSFTYSFNSLKPLLVSMLEDVTFGMRNSTYANNYFTTSNRGTITYLTLKNDVVYSKGIAFVAGLSKYQNDPTGNALQDGEFNAEFYKKF